MQINLLALLLKLITFSLCVLDCETARRPSVPAPARQTCQETRKTIHFHRSRIPKVPGGILFQTLSSLRTTVDKRVTKWMRICAF